MDDKDIKAVPEKIEKRSLLEFAQQQTKLDHDITMQMMKGTNLQKVQPPDTTVPIVSKITIKQGDEND